MRWRKVLRWVFYAFFLVVVFIGLCNFWIVRSTADRIFSNVEEIPYNRVALVLGTSNKLTNGSPNPFFENRMQAAAALYIQKKVSHFILSGDNRSQYYNEPQEMKKALMSLGVPGSAITLDFAGLRTLDSVVRSKEIFGQNKITIITQSFHCSRALFISNYYDIDAVAVIASDPTLESFPLREYLARTKAVLDLYVLKTTPRFLGEKEYLNI